MRAAVLPRYGPPDTFTLREVQPPPLRSRSDVRIAVRAAGVNPIDAKFRAGLQRGAMWVRLPWIPGLDVAGEVIEVGPDVTWFRPGDPVMGCADWRRPGSYAEQCVVEQRSLVRKPPWLSFPQAAALPLAGLTAWQCLVPRLHERAGQRVLVQAGAGGVGHLAIQLAKHLGAWVAATASKRNHPFLRDLGADEVIDYRDERWWRVVRRPDLVLDAIGGRERRRARKAVRRRGRVASIVSGLAKNHRRFGPTLGTAATGVGLAGFWLRGRLRGVDTTTVVMKTDAEQLSVLADLADRGVIRVHVEQTLPLDEVAEAHRLCETGHVRGKLVLTV